MALSPRQRQFRSLVFGSGTPYAIISEQGLETLAVRSGTRPAPRAAGSIPGLHVADSKRIVLRLRIEADSPAQAEEDLAALRAVVAVSESEQHQYRFRHMSGVESFVWARVIDRPGARDTTTEGVGLVESRIGFEVADPRIYSVEMSDSIIPLFSVGGGELDFPGEFPADWGAIVQTNATLVNAGDQDAFPLFRFQFPAGGSGDCDGVTVTNTTNGDVLEIAATNLLAAGQTLVADMDAYARAIADDLVVSIGSSSRFGAWSHPRDPLRLSPGENILTFEVDGTTEDIIARADWRSTSL
jgi:hypothetical protein